MIHFYSLNGTILPLGETQLHVTDLGLLRGYAVFDYFRVIQGKPLFLEDYLDRFYRSAEMLYLTPPLSRAELRENILSLIHKNLLPDAAIRLLLTGGYAEDGYTPQQPNLIVLEHAFSPPPAHFYTSGARLCTHLHTREFPEIKSTNYLTGIHVQHKVKAANADFVLYHDGQWVSESDRSNIGFVTAEGQIITPQKNILLGVTRKNLLAEAQKYFQLERREVSLQEAFQAKEGFFMSTTKGIMPISQIDQHTYQAPGPFTKKLMELFEQVKTAYLSHSESTHGRVLL